VPDLVNLPLHPVTATRVECTQCELPLHLALMLGGD
jgi:hypothetical protein